MTNQELNHYVFFLGLQNKDLDPRLKSKQELIEAISKSSILYYTSLKHIILNEIRDYFQDSSIQFSEEVKSYFPRKNRKSQWIKFSEFLSFKIPGLRLTNLGKTSLVLLAITFVLLFITSFEEMLNLKLSGLSLGPILSGIVFLPIGLVWMFSIRKLPGKTISDLIDKIIEINTIELLYNHKENFKARLNRELSSN